MPGPGSTYTIFSWLQTRQQKVITNDFALSSVICSPALHCPQLRAVAEVKATDSGCSCRDEANKCCSLRTHHLPQHCLRSAAPWGKGSEVMLKPCPKLPGPQAPHLCSAASLPPSWPWMHMVTSPSLSPQALAQRHMAKLTVQIMVFPISATTTASRRHCHPCQELTEMQE